MTILEKKIMEKTTETTVKQLRNLLFNIDNQEMTIRELRSLLFVAEDDCILNRESMEAITSK